MQTLRKICHSVGAAAAVGLMPVAQAWAQAADATAAAAAAAPATPPPPVLNPGDTAWMLTSSVLVLMMTLPGLALFYGGLVRKKNVLSVLMQSIFGTGIVSVLWVLFGYSLAFTDGTPWIGDFSRAMLNGVTIDTLSSLAATIPETVYCFFQATFAIITAVIILGGPADRLKFSSAMIFISAWLILVYCPVAHWVWSAKGYFATLGALDFAGGTVVHINSAAAALVATLMVGKRHGHGTENMAPHNLILTLIGGALLWVGWFGFNAGSATAANGLAGYAALNTHLATAAAVVTWSLAEWVLRGKPSLLGAVSGAVAGLVAITPACGFVNLTGALVIGLLAGVVCFWGVTGLKSMFGYDDALDVVGVHGVGGVMGALLTGVFAVAAVGGTGKSGLIDGNPGQILIQAEAVLATIVWSSFVSFIILKVIDLTIGLRVNKEVEVEGLDINLHGEVVHS